MSKNIINLTLFNLYSPFAPVRNMALSLGSSFIDSLPGPTQKLLSLRKVQDLPQVSLTDSQDPHDQLRFFQQERIFRYLRDLSVRLAEAKVLSTSLVFHGSSFAFITPPINLLLQFLNEAQVAFEIAIESTVQPIPLNIPPDALHTFALERMSAGDSWAVLQVLESVPEAFIPEEFSRLKGLCLALTGQTEDAELYLRQWHNLTSPVNQAWALYSLAMLYARHHSEERRSLDQAETFLEEASEKLRLAALLDSGIAAAATMHAGLYREEKNFTEAIRLHTHAIALEPSDASHRIELAETLILAGQTKNAINLLNQIDGNGLMNTDPELWQNWMIMQAEASLQLGDLVGAQSVLTRAKLQFPESKELRTNHEILFASA